MELSGKKVAVVGLRRSGMAAAKLLRESGASVWVTDSTSDAELERSASVLRAEGVEVELGAHTEEFISGSELVVVSPGVPKEASPIRWADEKSIPVISELELAFNFCKAKSVIAITGTNGKTTVTMLIGEIIKAAGKECWVCGNIGEPFSSKVKDIGEEDIVVLEVSSFQLERIGGFKPNIGIVLNVTQDHLDRYGSMEEYRKAKLKLFQNQDWDDYAILNFDDSIAKGFAKEVRSKPLYYSIKRGVDEGACIKGMHIVTILDKKIMAISERLNLRLLGEHNLENALASALTATLLGIEAETIAKVLGEFTGLAHRFEMVESIGGVEFIDDSKATNVDSTMRALQACNKKVVLIAGGRDKASDFRVARKIVKEKVSSLVLIGEARERIAKVLDGHAPQVDFADSMRDAVRKAFSLAKRNYTVLLSPMCASFDMFKDYAERGRIFKEEVGKLKTSASPDASVAYAQKG